MTATGETQIKSTSLRAGRLLIAVYAILTLAASGRSIYQISTRFSEAPLAYSLSALSALVYLLATLSLSIPSWRRWAYIPVTFELCGVLIVGTATLIGPDTFGHPFGAQSTVWSLFGIGYGFLPLLLPILGLIWLRCRVSSRRKDEGPV